MPENSTISGSCVNLTFYRFISPPSSTKENLLGFQLIYLTKRCTETVCKSVCQDYSAPNGILNSPNYPVPYTEDVNCTYTITQPNGTIIILEVVTFDLEHSWSATCKDSQDNLEIRDGSTKESPLIGRFCSNNIPASMESTQNNMWIR